MARNDKRMPRPALAVIVSLVCGVSLFPAAMPHAQDLGDEEREPGFPGPADERLRDPAEEGDPEGTDQQPGVDVDIYAGGGGTASELVHVPIGRIVPGDVRVTPTIQNPFAEDPESAQRGMKYYNQFNCVGCHAPNGSGGMGPSLSNTTFLYGEKPENIFLSILQGRPNGMPAWGGVLPDHVIWDLVSYIKSISKAPAPPWGRTTSADGFTIEQVPAEFMRTTNPWQYTTPFSYGQPPFVKPEGSPPLETPGETQP